jgi:hypothetical protein
MMYAVTEVRELPAYRAVLAVDVKNFSGVKAVDHHELTEAIPEVLKRAFERAGYARVWEEKRFPAGRGDGYVVGFRPEVLPILLGPVVDALQDELAFYHRMRAGGPGFRMRVSIGVGPLTDSDEGRLGDGSGAAMIETHRLLDCQPVRDLLENSDPEVTFIAVVISGRVYEDVVAAGYATKAPSEFLEVPVEVKSYRGTAFLHVPRMSGKLLNRAEETADPEPPTAVEQAGGRSSVRNSIVGQVSGTVLQSGDLRVDGPFTIGGPPRS